MKLLQFKALRRILISFLGVLAGLYLMYFTLGDPLICLPFLPNLAESINLQNASAFSYFSSNRFNRNNLSTFTVQWYSKNLRAMNEPSFLFLPGSQDESYRFLWLRSFHRPVSGRVWRSGSKHYINVKQLERRPYGLADGEPNKLITNEARLLTQSEWDQFINLLQRSCYWSLSTEAKDPLGFYSTGKDGARWVLEAVRDGHYHVVDRWTPESGNYRAVCIFLLELTRLNPEPIY